MIYICIPAHNEERTAGVLLWKIRQVMTDFRRDYEVLFLDDASTDRTYEVVSPYVQVLPLAILRNETRKGHGASLERLLREAVARCSYPRRDIIVTLQADFTDEPLAIPTMVKRIEGGADLVVAAQPNGSRLPLVIRWVRRGLLWLERKYHLPQGVSDPISGLRAYRVGLVKRALRGRDGEPLVRRDGWAASLELLMAVAPHTKRVEELQSEARYDRQARSSRLSLWRAARDYIGLLRQR
ncbi:MAG: glycosyltransferase family 2 protein [Gemmatimonadota bacterium]|nr:MAG: glycosyltransferase family 2 protein [Gemmatimonadota bacterium]